ncbi:hypothetical protein [Bacteriovorax sp. DB6_IX]|uniref:hypothetical protein n=1 Tax=Bacteriovorax sp. DB6_IX TaxID=1353530 RepID=UPI00038A1703|nr:hypothetical protein [Bacteriovorax sp. DB6_IX]EQC49794.1 hypothetical protein M901_2015 [Bacteriovorax sp. DB6_IX]
MKQELPKFQDGAKRVKKARVAKNSSSDIPAYYQVAFYMITLLVVAKLSVTVYLQEQTIKELNQQVSESRELIEKQHASMLKIQSQISGLEQSGAKSFARIPQIEADLKLIKDKNFRNLSSNNELIIKALHSIKDFKDSEAPQEGK